MQLTELGFQIHGAKLTVFLQGSPTVCLYLNNFKDIAKEHTGTSRCLDCLDCPQFEHGPDCF